ncbi:LINE-1 reverse transcriptase-like protein, partial [Heterocephalus glaber]
LSNCRGIVVIPCLLSDHSAIKLEINSIRNCRYFANTWKLNNTLLNNQWVIEEIKEEIRWAEKQFLQLNDNASTTYRNIWDTMKAL